jgi:hypothetical protein
MLDSTKITKKKIYIYIYSHGNVVGIVTSYGLDCREIGVQGPGGQKFLLPHIVQTGFGVHPTSYAVSTGVSFPGGKAAGS